jgi:hypothetical protein
MARRLILPPGAPWEDVTFSGVYWNCGRRLERLLATVRPWFTNIVVCVQESPDATLDVAKEYADVVVEDEWRGYGDASFPLLLQRVRTKWTFVVSDDEMPTRDLLASFQDLVDTMPGQGAWFHFRSWIDDIEFTSEQDWHLRFFETRVGWPGTLHSRPPIDGLFLWRPVPSAVIQHRRSLDEMIRDYLRYIESTESRSWASEQMRAHNRLMIRDAIVAVAQHKGADYVRKFDWFEKAKEVADVVLP